MSKFRFLRKDDKITVTADDVTQAAMDGITLSEHLNKKYYKEKIKLKNHKYFLYKIIKKQNYLKFYFLKIHILSFISYINKR